MRSMFSNDLNFDWHYAKLVVAFLYCIFSNLMSNVIFCYH